MTNHAIGIRSLAVNFPSLIRTNDYWRQKFPELATQPQRIRLPRTPTGHDDGREIWSQEVAPYLNDPFRGNVERRVLSPEESPLTLECQAAQEALEVAHLHPSEVDLVIATSLFADPTGLGHATTLAHQLNLNCPAWNLESTCSSALIALQNAHALVQAGIYHHVLVVVSQIGSNAVDDADTLSWSMGDGAGALVVSTLKGVSASAQHSGVQGILGSKIISTAVTHGAYTHELIADGGVSRLRTRTGENAGLLAETAVDFVRTCCQGAAVAAGVSLDQINFFAFNTPTAWYASVCTRALGIDPERTINLYPRYANIGPVFLIANLYHAAQGGKLQDNDLVLVYTNGAGATAGAMVMRWGEVALGTNPAPPLSVTSEAENVHLAVNSSQKTELLSSTEIRSISREQLLATAPDQRLLLLESYLLGWLTHSLQLPAHHLNLHQCLTSFLDSLMVLMFRSQIETDLQVQVPMEKFMGEITVAQLAINILNQCTLANLIDESINSGESHQQEREKLSL